MRSQACLVVLVFVAPACSSSSSSSTPSDGSPSSDAVSEASSQPEGAASAGNDGAGGSAPDGSGDDGPTVCNTLVNSGQPVTAMRVASAPPAAQGGTPANGTYLLTSETIYTGAGGATGPSGTQSITIQIQGSTIQVAKSTSPLTSTYDLSTTGTTYTAAGECPPLVGGLMGSYTATTTTFVVSIAAIGSDAGAPTTVETFTKQ
jgi:hypothetical protein